MLRRLLIISAFLALHSTNAVPTGRIVGGANANIGQFPHQVSLQREDGTHLCGGSIISAKYIVTAAHCVGVNRGLEPYPTKYLQVRVGSIQRIAAGQILQLKRIIVNKNYRAYLNDVALLELEKPLVFTRNIQPIEMASEEVPSGEDVIISGWGRLYNLGPNPQRLQWTTLRALNNTECDELIRKGDDCMICLAHLSNNGACAGDSGGPATYNGKLVGVANFVVEGCGTKYPDGYAKIAFHRNWIQSIIGEQGEGETINKNRLLS